MFDFQMIPSIKFCVPLCGFILVSFATVQGQCGDGEFLCGSGEYIAPERKCDNVPDCEDDSDETDCAIQLSCTESSRPCSDQSKCIAPHQFCNGIPDCDDKSDEKNCENGPPESELTVRPSIIEEGTQCLLHCSSVSTTVPDTHNLTIHVSWYIDGQVVKSGGRFIVNKESLIINSVTRADVNRVITCEAREEGGLPAWTTTTLLINWGPDPGPVLQPPCSVYFLGPDEQLPIITCSADCHPECDFTWLKLDSTESVLSNNETLWLDDSNGIGEYICVATRNGTSRKGNISVTVVLKQGADDTTVSIAASMATVNHMSVAIVGAVLGTALLLAIILIVYLLRRGHSLEAKISVTAAAGRPDASFEMRPNACYEHIWPDRSTSHNYYAVTDECTNTTAHQSLFVNINGTIRFNADIETGKRARYLFNDIYRIHEGRRERICSWIIYRTQYAYPTNTKRGDCVPEYENRTSFHTVLVDFHKARGYFAISDADSSDNGTYLLSRGYSIHSMCFIVYIYGPPSSEITLKPPIIEEGTEGLLHCSTVSTTVPGTHNLTIHVSWYIDGQVVKTGGRFILNGETLIINSVTRTDVNRVITCEAREKEGLTTWTNTTLSIHWGPDPGPVLQPPCTAYLLEPDKQVPVINCSADCHPECDFTWLKLGSRQSVLSNNGALRLVGSDIVGEYMCVATRNGTSRKSNSSVIVFFKQETHHSPAPISASEVTLNYVPVVVVGGVLGTALLLAIILIVYLLRRGHLSEASTSTTVAASRPEASFELRTQNTTYEHLGHDRSTSQNYAAVNRDLVTDGTDGGSRNENVRSSTDYIDVLPSNELYENADIDKRT